MLGAEGCCLSLTCALQHHNRTLVHRPHTHLQKAQLYCALLDERCHGAALDGMPWLQHFASSAHAPVPRHKAINARPWHGLLWQLEHLIVAQGYLHLGQKV